MDDVGRANAARMYDYLLGGGHNFAVDREHIARLIEANPDVAVLARSNRAVLGRVVRWCVERGIDQFLDLGSGVPTVGNVHEVAPSARVAYVDNEPVAVAHSTEIVADVDGVTITDADLRDADAVLAAPGVTAVIDLDRPLALLAVSCLHFVPGDLRPVLARYRRRLAPGSVLAISHASADVDDAAVAARMTAMAAAFRTSASPQTLRDRAEIAGLFDGFAIVPPGIVDLTAWPEPRPGAVCTGGLVAVGVL